MDDARAGNAVFYAGFAAVTGAVAWLGHALVGWPGVVVAVAVAAWVGPGLISGRRLQQAHLCLARQRLDEAEAILRRLAASPLGSRGLRASALNSLGRIAVRRADHEGALAHFEKGARLIPIGSRFRLTRAFAERSEILCLVNLAREAEARPHFESLGPAPDADHLRLVHFTAELYLCFAEGKHALSPDELHLREGLALGIPSAGALLGLCAWAYGLSGDAAKATHLRGECLSRQAACFLPAAFPRLHSWLLATPPPPAGA